jgi:hypothetical protein
VCLRPGPSLGAVFKTGPVSEVELSPDGELVAVAGAERVVVMRRDGTERRVLGGLPSRLPKGAEPRRLRVGWLGTREVLTHWGALAMRHDVTRPESGTFVHLSVGSYVQRVVPGAVLGDRGEVVDADGQARGKGDPAGWSRSRCLLRDGSLAVGIGWGDRVAATARRLSDGEVAYLLAADSTEQIVGLFFSGSRDADAARPLRHRPWAWSAAEGTVRRGSLRRWLAGEVAP